MIATTLAPPPPDQIVPSEVRTFDSWQRLSQLVQDSAGIFQGPLDPVLQEALADPRTQAMMDNVQSDILTYRLLAQELGLPPLELSIAAQHVQMSTVSVDPWGERLALRVRINQDSERSLVSEIGNELFNMEVFLKAMNEALALGVPLHNAIGLARNESTHPVVESASFAINYIDSAKSLSQSDARVAFLELVYKIGLDLYSQRYNATTQPVTLRSHTDEAGKLLAGSQQRFAESLEEFVEIYGADWPEIKAEINNTDKNADKNGSLDATTVRFKVADP